MLDTDDKDNKLERFKNFIIYRMYVTDKEFKNIMEDEPISISFILSFILLILIVLIFIL